MTGTGATEVMAHPAVGGMSLRSNKGRKEDSDEFKEDDSTLVDAAFDDAEVKMMDDDEIESVDEFGNPIIDTVKMDNRNLTVALARSVAETSGNTVIEDNSGASHQDGQRMKHSKSPVENNLSDSGADLTRRSSDESVPELRPGVPRLVSAPSPTALAPALPPPVMTVNPPPIKTIPLVKPAPLTPAFIPPSRQRSTSISRPAQTSHGVPNPLADISIATPPMEVSSIVKIENTTLSAPITSTVPCPLPAVPSVPCPLPAPIEEAIAEEIDPSRVVSQQPAASQSNDPFSMTRRGRIFSMDIDPDGLDFPDMSVENLSGDFNTSPALPPINHGGKQSSNNMNPPLNQAGNFRSTPMLQAAGRDRAMSFEFFSLGINADEPLPPAPDFMSSSLDHDHFQQRPRGDSIIFDPASFQDGGIHEEKALFRSRTNSVDLPSKDELAIMNTPGFVAPPSDSSSKLNANKATANSSLLPTQATSSISHQKSSQTLHSQQPNSAQMATLPSSLNNSMNHATFQMDLLNKDGRIGIYLPDARRARIAKFHSKRKMRIWRKRIKYDCRKKLADSRPRIKGRFVKRSDMDED